ncbi:unnamed protein product, partial [Amoebophrya sp. A120]
CGSPGARKPRSAAPGKVREEFRAPRPRQRRDRISFASYSPAGAPRPASLHPLRNRGPNALRFVFVCHRSAQAAAR